MASPVIPNCVQIRLLWASEGNLAINVLNAEAGAGVLVNQALANTVGSAIKSAFTSNLAAHYTGNTGLVRIGLRDMRQPNQAEFLDTTTATAGTGVGEPLPAATAMCLTLRTAKTGKSFTGRIYLPAMTEGDNTGLGVALAAAATAAVAFLNAVSAALASANLFLAVASRASELIRTVRTIFFDDGTQESKTISEVKRKDAQLTRVTSILSRTSGWESQRRRGNGRGTVPGLLTPVAMVEIGQPNTAIAGTVRAAR